MVLSELASVTIFLGCAIALFFVHYCSVEESFTYC
jgi:uncharacterized membrane protein YwzB